MFIIKPNGDVFEKNAQTHPYTLTDLQEIVGGYIEYTVLPFSRYNSKLPDVHILANEEGSLENLPPNSHIHKFIAQRFKIPDQILSQIQALVGTIIVFENRNEVLLVLN